MFQMAFLWQHACVPRTVYDGKHLVFVLEKTHVVYDWMEIGNVQAISNFVQDMRAALEFN